MSTLQQFSSIFNGFARSQWHFTRISSVAVYIICRFVCTQEPGNFVTALAVYVFYAVAGIICAPLYMQRVAVYIICGRSYIRSGKIYVIHAPANKRKCRKHVMRFKLSVMEQVAGIQNAPAPALLLPAFGSKPSYLVISF